MEDSPVQFALGKKKVADDLKALVADSQELLRLTSGASQSGVQAMRSRMQEHIDTARNALAGTQVGAMSRGRETLDQVEDFVRAKPWQAVVIGLGIGVLLGALSAR